jgi:hypothetical protein
MLRTLKTELSESCSLGGTGEALEEAVGTTGEASVGGNSVGV